MWNDLSMAQKSELMKMFIQNGVYDLNTIIKEYDSRHQSGDEATLPNYSQNVFAEGGNIGSDEYNTLDNRGHLYQGYSEPTQKMHTLYDEVSNQIYGILPELTVSAKAPKGYAGYPKAFEEEYNNNGGIYGGFKNKDKAYKEWQTTQKYFSPENLDKYRWKEFKPFAPLVAGSMAAPAVVSAGAALAPIVAESAPIVGGYATKFGLPLATAITGGKALDDFIARNGKYRGFADWANQTLYRENATPENEEVLEFFNPGYAVAGIPNTAIKGIKAINKAVESTTFGRNARITSELNKAIRSTNLSGDITIGNRTLNQNTRFRVGDVELGDPSIAYRQGSKEMIDDFINTGIVRSDGLGASANMVGKFNLHKNFENPMFMQGNLWYGVPEEGGSRVGLLTTREPLQVATKTSNANKHYSSIAGTSDVQTFGLDMGRRIPLDKTQLNLRNTTPYIFDSNYGYRRIGNDIPTLDQAYQEARNAKYFKGAKEAKPFIVGDNFSYKIATDENIEKYNPNLKSNIIDELRELEKSGINIQNDNELDPIFQLALHTKRGIKAYPNGVDVFYRTGTTNPLYGNWERMPTRYEPALFGGDKEMAAGYIGGFKMRDFGTINEFDKLLEQTAQSHIQNVTPKENAAFQLVVPKGLIYDLGDLKGIHWNDLIGDKQLYDYYSNLAQQARLQGDPAKATSILKDRYMYVPELQIPLRDGHFEGIRRTDNLMRLFKSNDYDAYNGYLFRNLKDGPTSNEVIWDMQHGPMPKSAKASSLIFDLEDRNVFHSFGGQLGHITPYGQWQYPHQITTIPSNNITMQGVNYPVIGISNTGDTKVMLPGLDYLYDGNYVTEYPL